MTKTSYQILEQLQKLLPIFIKSTDNKNYMGRLMCAKAIIPFISLDKISNLT